MSAVGYVPVDFSQVPLKVVEFEHALLAIRHTDRLCQLIYNQPNYINNRHLLIANLVAHTVTAVLPTPKAVNSDAAASCFWGQLQFRFERQLDLMILLDRLMRHFVCAIVQIPDSRVVHVSKYHSTSRPGSYLDLCRV